MNLKPINWTRAILGALVAEVAQICAAFAWVAIYSHAISPGRPFHEYQAYAQLSGPWVSIIAGGAIFYFASRWVARNRATALALFAVYLVIDIAILIAAIEPGAYLPYALFVLSFVSKALICYLGGLHAEKRSASAPA